LNPYSGNIPYTIHPATVGSNIHNINSKRYVLNFNILKIFGCKGTVYFILSKRLI
jgi:hypothetical protein